MKPLHLLAMRGTILFVLLPLLFAQTVYAEFADDCASPQSDDWHAYQNLMLTQNNAAVDLDWPTAPDRTALSVASPQAGAAAALYAVSGASGVELSLYSMFGTFATPYSGGWAQGIPVGTSFAQAKRLFISPASSRLYLNANGWMTPERDEIGDFTFRPLASAPSEALEAYGLTVLCSSDGQRFTPVSITLRAVRCAAAERVGFACYYETYAATVPPGTRFLRVELREVDKFFFTGGGTQQNTARGSMRLASVRFLGDAVRGSLSTPPPTPEPSNPTAPAPSSPSSSDPDLQQPSSSRPAPAGGGDRGSRSSKSPSASSKPPRSSSSAPSSKRPSAARPAASAEKPAASAASSQPEEPASSSAQEPRAPVPERTAAPKARTETRTLVLGGGYVICASAALFFFARKK